MRSIAFKLALLVCLSIAAFGQTQTNLDTQVKGSRLPSWGTDSGTANAYVVTTIAPAGPTLRTGSRYMFVVAHTNTSASTLTVDGINHSVKKNISTALAASDWTVGQIVEVAFDGTNFQWISAGTISALPGSVTCAQLPALTGDVTTPAGSCATTLANTAVTPTSYTLASITVDSKGRITAASNGTAGAGTQYHWIANCASTGTTVNKLAKWGNVGINSGCAVITTTADATDGIGTPVIGICVSGCGTTGLAKIATGGQAVCQLDSSTSVAQGDSIKLSATVNGDCAGLSTGPANENPESHYLEGTSDAAAIAGATVTVNIAPISLGFGNATGNPLLPPNMTLMAGSSYGATRSFPSIMQQTGPTGKQGTDLLLPSWTSGGWLEGLRFGDPSGNGAFYTKLEQCGGGVTCGLSSHDFRIDTRSNGFSGGAAIRFESETGQSETSYSPIDDEGSVTGTVNFYPWNGNVKKYTLTGNTTLVNNTAIIGEQRNPGTIFAFLIVNSGSFTLTVPADWHNFPTVGASTTTTAFCAVQSDNSLWCSSTGGTSGSAGGDLSGTYPNPTVAQVNGAVVPASATATATNSSRQIIAATMQGNGSKVQASTGSTTTNDCVKFDANGNTVDAGSACGAGGGGDMLTTSSNTMGAAGTIDASAQTGSNSFKVPVKAGATATANGALAYDSTNNNLHAANAAADAIVPVTTVTPTDTNCVQWSVSSGKIKLADAGAACAGGSSSQGYSAVSFSATPTFDASGGVQTFKITLTGNVTSSTFSNGVTGQFYTFIVCQDSTGGRAFVPPSAMKQYSTWMAGPSGCSNQQFAYDGTNLNAVATWTPDTRPVTAGALDDEFDGNTMSGSWTWQNQGTSTTTEQNGLLQLQPQVNSGAHNIVMIKQTYPNGNHSYITKVYPQGFGGNGWGGLCISDGTKYYAFLVGNASDLPQILFDTWTNTSSPSTVLNTSWSGATELYIKLADDGTTNRVWSYSTNGAIWEIVKTESRTATLTATTVGLCANVTSSAALPNLVFDWFREQ